MSEDSRKMALEIARILDSKKALDITILDISEKTIIADYFVIASARSEIQVKALYDELQKVMKERNIEPSRQDGSKGARWIVLDYGAVIVHIFHQEERSFYNLERLWADAVPLYVDNL